MQPSPLASGGGETFPTADEICLGRKLRFPAYGEDSLISNVLFITGKRGSGKSFTAGVMMEEFHRLGLQFVCFDALDAHGGLDQMTRVESIKPSEGQSIEMKSLVDRLKTTDKSLVIKMGGLSLTKQQELIGDYCEALIEARLSKGLHTIFEECQDFTDKRLIKKILSGIASARKGECVAYAPEFFRDRGYIVIDKIRGDRQTKHTGNNIDVQSALDGGYTSSESLVDDSDLRPADAISSAEDAAPFARKVSMLEPATSPLGPAVSSGLGLPLNSESSSPEDLFRNYPDWEPSEPEYEYDPVLASEAELGFNSDWADEPASKTSRGKRALVPFAAVGGVGLASALILTVMRGFRIR
jgi:hypothetical protein